MTPETERRLLRSKNSLENKNHKKQDDTEYSDFESFFTEEEEEEEEKDVEEVEEEEKYHYCIPPPPALDFNHVASVFITKDTDVLAKCFNDIYEQNDNFVHFLYFCFLRHIMHVHHGKLNAWNFRKLCRDTMLRLSIMKKELTRDTDKDSKRHQRQTNKRNDQFNSNRFNCDSKKGLQIKDIIQEINWSQLANPRLEPDLRTDLLAECQTRAEIKVMGKILLKKHFISRAFGIRALARMCVIRRMETFYKHNDNDSDQFSVYDDLSMAMSMRKKLDKQNSLNLFDVQPSHSRSSTLRSSTLTATGLLSQSLTKKISQDPRVNLNPETAAVEIRKFVSAESGIQLSRNSLQSLSNIGWESPRYIYAASTEVDDENQNCRNKLEYLYECLLYGILDKCPDYCLLARNLKEYKCNLSQIFHTKTNVCVGFPVRAAMPVCIRRKIRKSRENGRGLFSNISREDGDRMTVVYNYDYLFTVQMHCAYLSDNRKKIHLFHPYDQVPLCHKDGDKLESFFTDLISIPGHRDLRNRCCVLEFDVAKSKGSKLYSVYLKDVLLSEGKDMTNKSQMERWEEWTKMIKIPGTNQKIYCYDGCRFTFSLPHQLHFWEEIWRNKSNADTEKKNFSSVWGPFHRTGIKKKDKRKCVALTDCKAKGKNTRVTLSNPMAEYEIGSNFCQHTKVYRI